MTTWPARWRLRSVTRAMSAAVAVLLAVAVFAGEAQAGRSYVYCLAMQEVMEHTCCSGRVSPASSTAPTVAAVPRDCCQARTMPVLGSWTPTERATPPLAFASAVPWLSAARFAVVASPANLPDRDPTMRGGPPISRVLARLMVLHI